MQTSIFWNKILTLCLLWFFSLSACGQQEWSNRWNTTKTQQVAIQTIQGKTQTTGGFKMTSFSPDYDDLHVPKNWTETGNLATISQANTSTSDCSAGYNIIMNELEAQEATTIDMNLFSLWIKVISISGNNDVLDISKVVGQAPSRNFIMEADVDYTGTKHPNVNICGWRNVDASWGTIDPNTQEELWRYSIEWDEYHSTDGSCTSNKYSRGWEISGWHFASKEVCEQYLKDLFGKCETKISFNADRKYDSGYCYSEYHTKGYCQNNPATCKDSFE